MRNIGIFLCSAAMMGCTTKASEQAVPKPPEAIVALPIRKPVADHEDFTGKTESVSRIVIKARVKGHIFKVNFKDGQDIKEGDVLFEIDPRPYQADVNRTEGALEQAKARAERLDEEYVRAQAQGSSLSRQELTKARIDLAEAQAQVKVAQANLDTATKYWEFCKVEWKVDWKGEAKTKGTLIGRVGKRLYDQGNFIKDEDTALTDVVVIEPNMYAQFFIDERTMLKLREHIKSGKMLLSQDSGLSFQMGMGDNAEFPISGTIDFVDNKMDVGTGTLLIRGIFDNRKEKLLPGTFIRIRLPVGEPREALLITEQALSQDQGEKIVYVVKEEKYKKDEHDKDWLTRFVVKNTPVKLGPLVGGMRVIESGISENDMVLVTGLQRVKDGMIVTPSKVAMEAKLKSLKKVEEKK